MSSPSQITPGVRSDMPPVFATPPIPYPPHFGRAIIFVPFPHPLTPFATHHMPIHPSHMTAPIGRPHFSHPIPHESPAFGPAAATHVYTNVIHSPRVPAHRAYPDIPHHLAAKLPPRPPMPPIPAPSYQATNIPRPPAYDAPHHLAAKSPPRPVMPSRSGIPFSGAAASKHILPPPLPIKPTVIDPAGEAHRDRAKETLQKHIFTEICEQGKKKNIFSLWDIFDKHFTSFSVSNSVGFLYHSFASWKALSQMGRSPTLPPAPCFDERFERIRTRLSVTFPDCTPKSLSNIVYAYLDICFAMLKDERFSTENLMSCANDTIIDGVKKEIIRRTGSPGGLSSFDHESLSSLAYSFSSFERIRGICHEEVLTVIAFELKQRCSLPDTDPCSLKHATHRQMNRYIKTIYAMNPSDSKLIAMLKSFQKTV